MSPVAIEYWYHTIKTIKTIIKVYHSCIGIVAILLVLRWGIIVILVEFLLQRVITVHNLFKLPNNGE